MSDAKRGISASQLGRHIGMTYKTAWYVAHRIREAMREANDIQLGDPDTTVEIDESYIEGQLRGLKPREPPAGAARWNACLKLNSLQKAILKCTCYLLKDP